MMLSAQPDVLVTSHRQDSASPSFFCNVAFRHISCRKSKCCFLDLFLILSSWAPNLSLSELNASDEVKPSAWRPPCARLHCGSFAWIPNCTDLHESHPVFIKMLHCAGLWSSVNPLTLDLFINIEILDKGSVYLVHSYHTSQNCFCLVYIPTEIYILV